AYCPVVENVREFVRDNLAQPFLSARPERRNIVEMDPDVGVPGADGHGEAVYDFVLVGEVDPNLVGERNGEVRAEGVVRFLGYGSRFDLDAGDVGRVDDPE